MIKNIIQKIKKYTIIAFILILIIAPITVSIKIGLIQFVNTPQLAAISFNKEMLSIND